jgi:hypothetical protein
MIFITCEALIAGAVLYIHVQLIRDAWLIWTYQLKYWAVAGFILQLGFFAMIFIFIGLSIYLKQSKTSPIKDF